MTTTVTRPRPAAASPQRPPAGPQPARTSGDNLALIALVAVTLSVGFGLGRLFTDLRFVPAIVGVALTCHVTAALARQRGMPTAGAGVLSALTGGVVLAWTVLPQTTVFGIPTLETLRAASRELQLAQTSFPEVVAPTEAVPGFLIAAAIGIGVAAFMGDWAAFRLTAAIESLVPSLTLFLFTSALAPARHRPLATAGFVGTSLVFLLAHEARQRVRTSAWFNARPGRGPGALLVTGAVLASVAVIGGLLVGPKLPGAGDKAIIGYRNRGSERSARTTISPLVDIRGRLVDRSGVEVFTVVANAPAYWRLTSLDTFDGEIWSSNESYKPVDERLRSDIPSRARTDELLQKFEISSLASIWLPAAFEPVRLEKGSDVRFNSDSASLITEKETGDGESYEVLSRVPVFTAEQLAAAPAVVPDRVEQYLSLPPIATRVVQLARQIVANAGASTPYEKSLALQNYLRGPLYTYDLEARQGHDGRALERFLFTNRRGYCEQFAGSYAVMARAIGLPTRVAVGFTPGERQGDRFQVRDEHAHAWPEVFIAGAGWVAFEPTPGRGAPNAQAYTGVEPQQDTTNDGRGEAPGGTTTTAAPAPGAGPTDTTIPQFEQDQQTGNGGSAVDEAPSGLRRVLTALSAILAAAGIWVLLSLLANRVRQRRRQASATTPEARVELAWLRASEALTRIGLPRRPAETSAEYAQRVAATGGLGGTVTSALQRLAQDTAAATFAAGGAVGEPVAERAETTAKALAGAVQETADWRQRLRWLVDPRPPRVVRALPR